MQYFHSCVLYVVDVMGGAMDYLALHILYSIKGLRTHCVATCMIVRDEA